jgi:hypothetical protein
VFVVLRRHVPNAFGDQGSVSGHAAYRVSPPLSVGPARRPEAGMIAIEFARIGFEGPQPPECLSSGASANDNEALVAKPMARS